MVTADTITDRQIQDLYIRAKVTGDQETMTACQGALAPAFGREHARAQHRARCAEIINGGGK